MGPRSRDVLQRLTEHDLSNAGFPFGRVKRITLAGAPVLALRVTYVGELGWELHIPVEFAAAVYDALMAAGEPHGIANAGYRAIESLRLEKGYRAWGADIGPDHSPLVAGLGWAVKLKSNTPFQGRAALEAQAAKKLPRLLAGFTTDPSVVLLGRETIYRDGKRVGWLSSGGYGYTVGRSIGYGYVRDPENGVDARQSCFPAATSSKSPRRACRPRFSSSRSTIRRCRASRAEARREGNGAQGRTTPIQSTQ